MSAGGHKRIGVVMVDPAHAKSTTYVATISAAVTDLQSDSQPPDAWWQRAARRTTSRGDAATAAMAAIAGYQPHISIVLKRDPRRVECRSRASTRPARS